MTKVYKFPVDDVKMQKGILILGIFLLIIGIIYFGFGVIAYTHITHCSLNQTHIPYLLNGSHSELTNRPYLEDAIGGFIAGVIFSVIGLVLLIVGFKGKSKKEKLSEMRNQ